MKLIFEKSRQDRRSFNHPAWDAKQTIPASYLKRATDIIGLPECSELEIIRHYVALAEMNFSIEKGLYPLGSCTMKYNPKINDEMAFLPGFRKLHPYMPPPLIQGALKLMDELEKWLCELSGMSAVTLLPAAGAQGEFCGLKLIRAYHEDHAHKKSKILIPDSAHGTNPASSALCGYDVVKVPSNAQGILDVQTIERLCDEETAAIMITNPNTLGLFEENIVKIAETVHRHKAFVYCDGANFNALMGKVKVSDLGIDVLQFNLHKTFSTPHGGGGPGAGPVGVGSALEPYLPIPRLKKGTQGWTWSSDFEKSIGRIKGFYGNFGVFVRAYTYMKALGGDGLTRVSELAVLNANYVKARLKDYFELPYDGQPCMHEVVLNDKKQNVYGIKTLDIAKRLIDYGFHPPTVYFPLIVQGALMIEPPETEPKEEIDRFCEAMIAIAKEAQEQPQVILDAPKTSPVKRVDEVRAARKLKLIHSE